MTQWISTRAKLRQRNARWPSFTGQGVKRNAKGIIAERERDNCAHVWSGTDAQPRKFVCWCGTIVYRDYESYCDD